MDSAQEALQAQIASLLREDWFTAMDRAQALLDTTSDTLKELHDVLLRDTPLLITTLQEIQALAEQHHAHLAVETTQRLIEKIDLLKDWGTARQLAWSDYYQYVHRYLRDIVRLDPDRALSHRLRDQLSQWSAQPFALTVAQTQKTIQLREISPRIQQKPVLRPTALRDHPILAATPQDEQRPLEVLVREAIAQGAQSLSQITHLVCKELPPEAHFAAIGRIAEVLPSYAKPHAERERPWITATPEIELEQWLITPLHDPEQG